MTGQFRRRPDDGRRGIARVQLMRRECLTLVAAANCRDAGNNEDRRNPLTRTAEHGALLPLKTEATRDPDRLLVTAGSSVARGATKPSRKNAVESLPSMSLLFVSFRSCRENDA